MQELLPHGIYIIDPPIKPYPFFKKLYEDGNEYLLHTPDGKQFIYRNYYDSYWTPVMGLIAAPTSRTIPVTPVSR